LLRGKENHDEFSRSTSSLFEPIPDEHSGWQTGNRANVLAGKYASVLLVRNEAAIKSRLNQMLELWTIRVFLIWRRTGRGTREGFLNFCRVAD